MHFAPLSRPIDTCREKFREHVVLVGRKDKRAYRKPHPPRYVARKDVTEIPRRHSKRYLLRVRRGGSKIAPEIVDGLCRNAGPVDGIDRAELVLLFEVRVFVDLFHHVLAIVENSFDGDVENILVGKCVHLFPLKFAHPTLWREHEDANTLSPAHRVLGGAPRVARRRAEDVELVAFFSAGGGSSSGGRKYVFKKSPKQLKCNVLESERWALAEVEEVKAFFEFLYRHDLVRAECFFCIRFVHYPLP